MLVLSWHDDPGHPVETGRRLADLIDGAELQTAATVEELRTWEVEPRPSCGDVGKA